MAQIYQYQSSEPLKMPKMYFLTVWIHTIWFHVKSEWQANCKIATLCCINFTFGKFLKHSVQGVLLKIIKSMKVQMFSLPFFIKIGLLANACDCEKIKQIQFNVLSSGKSLKCFLHVCWAFSKANTLEIQLKPCIDKFHYLSFME